MCADTVTELRKVHPSVKPESQLFDILYRHRKKSQTSPIPKEKKKTNYTGSRQRKAKNEKSLGINLEGKRRNFFARKHLQ